MNDQRIKLIVVGIIALVAVGFALYRARPTGQLPSDINFVCAVTGQSYKLDRNKVTNIPARNPKTGEFTLFPCFVTDEGILQVSARYAGGLPALGEKNRYVDPETLVVRPPP